MTFIIGHLLYDIYYRTFVIEHLLLDLVIGHFLKDIYFWSVSVIGIGLFSLILIFKNEIGNAFMSETRYFLNFLSALWERSSVSCHCHLLYSYNPCFSLARLSEMPRELTNHTRDTLKTTLYRR